LTLKIIDEFEIERVKTVKENEKSDCIKDFITNKIIGIQKTQIKNI
jgi:hypothetical protein